MIAHLHDSDAEMDRQYHRSLDRQQREIDRLTLSLTIRDNDCLTLRREIAALRAQVARSARKPPPWYLVALAALACAPPWLRRRLARCWPFWAAALATAALTGAAIVALRWIGGL